MSAPVPISKARKDRAPAEVWQQLLHRSERGAALDVLENAAIILRSDERLKDRLRWNDMLEAVEVRDAPWAKGGGWRAWTDVDDLLLASWCQQRKVYLKPRTVAAGVQVAARDRIENPLRDHLESLEWDGVERLNMWLITYLGARVEREEDEDGEAALVRGLYLREVGRRWMIAAVARVYEPGCKADHALILEGTQGALKSTTAAKLAMEPEWFADEIADLGTKDSAQDLRGKWIVELAELSAMQRREVERTKAFISRRVDHYRPSYGTRSQDFPRRCIFIGSTNEEVYLKDRTGNRRFWPVKVGKVDIAALERDRGQLWAEAVAAFKASERWWLDEATERAAREEQAERRMEDAWEPAVLGWAAHREFVTVGRALEHLGVPIERQDQIAQNRVAGILSGNGWKRTRRREEGVLTRGYVPVPGAGAETASCAGSDGTPGTAKASVSAAVPGVPGVPGVSSIRDVQARAGSVPGGTTRNTRNSTPLAEVVRDHRPIPAWTDDRGWIERIKEAPSQGERYEAVIRWGLEAQCKVDVVQGKTPGLRVPANLPQCLARKELMRVARDIGIRVMEQ